MSICVPAINVWFILSAEKHWEIHGKYVKLNYEYLEKNSKPSLKHKIHTVSIGMMCDIESLCVTAIGIRSNSRTKFQVAKDLKKQKKLRSKLIQSADTIKLF